MINAGGVSSILYKIRRFLAGARNDMDLGCIKEGEAVRQNEPPLLPTLK
jgi:hypothetical protein